MRLGAAIEASAAAFEGGHDRALVHRLLLVERRVRLDVFVDSHLAVLFRDEQQDAAEQRHEDERADAEGRVPLYMRHDVMHMGIIHAKGMMRTADTARETMFRMKATMRSVRSKSLIG